MLKVVKIGGNIVDNPEKLDKFLVDFASLEGEKILIHGGGKVATTIAKSLGIESVMIDGRRVTDGETLKVVTMVYAGLINKTIVSKLRAAGCDAFGLCGADGGFITSVRRAPKPIDYGFVGDPVAEKFGVGTAMALIETGKTLIVAPITDDGQGSLLNTNADTVAQTVAVGMSEAYEVELIYCFEKNGVMRDIDDPSSVIPEISPADFERLKAEGIVADGMLPKLENAFKAIRSGVKRVVICNAELIAKEGYGGTTLKA